MAPPDSDASAADPLAQARRAALELGRRLGVDRHDVLVVLGSGLAPAAPLLGSQGPPLDLTTLPWFPRFTGVGHRSEAWSVALAGHRLLVTAGRAHLYEGLSVHQVAHTVRTAVAAGCGTIVLTCAAGAIRPDLATGSVVAIADHLNLTGRSPLTGTRGDQEGAGPFVDLVDAWSPRLRALARRADPALREGVYAQLPGPHFETPAEIRMLATLGADLVGMSTALEAIAARHLGAEVLGLAVVTNPAAGVAPGPLSVDEVLAAAGGASPQVARIVTAVVEGLGDPPGRPETQLPRGPVPEPSPEPRPPET